MSAFSVIVDAKAALDFTMGDLAKDADRWKHPSNYAATQQLTADARTIGVEVIRALSARRQDLTNVALLDATALVPPSGPHSSWAFLATNKGLIATGAMGGPALRVTTGGPEGP
jgi:hypothetical protein